MLKRRVIPVVLMRNGTVVQSKGFNRYQRLGNPTTIVQRLSDWGSDELIYLDISQQCQYDLGRDDLNTVNHHNLVEILSEIATCCFMPLSFGGQIRCFSDVYQRLRNGADKITINTQAIERPNFINECAREFGSQCIIVSIDALGDGVGGWEVYKRGGRETTNLDAINWGSEVESRGAGEILINSIARDGSGLGYDIPLIQAMVEAVSIPVIALGGVGQWEHLADGIVQGGADAVAAANIFNYTENSVYEAKQFLFEMGLNVREPCLGYSV